MNRVFIILLLLTTSFSVLAAEGFSSLEEQMTGREFETAGLEKLSPQELDQLNAWIRKNSLATLATPAAKSTIQTTAAPKADDSDEKAKKDKKDSDRSPVTSKLVGKFSGWDGQTVFELENGQIWAQKSKKKFHTKEIDKPAVVIEPGMFGSWRLHVEGLDEDCSVVRIQ